MNARFSGGVAGKGEATALVVYIGLATIFSGAASAAAEAEETSPFQRDLHSYGLLTAWLYTFGPKTRRCGREADDPDCGHLDARM